MFVFSRVVGGARAASTSIGIIGAVLKALSILRRPRFYRSWSGFLNCAWPFHQITNP